MEGEIEKVTATKAYDKKERYRKQEFNLVKVRKLPEISLLTRDLGNKAY